jgi:hypothetical protein
MEEQPLIIQKNKKQSKIMQAELIEFVEETIDMYRIERSPYAFSEFIPTTIIPTVMKHHFPSSELLYSYNDNVGLYKITIRDLFVATITNWEYNRPPDMIRCLDIARYIYNSRKPIETVIYLHFNNICEIFEVLDGIHRITALKIIKEENEKPIDLLCPNDFSNADWLYNQYILVNIRFNATDLIEFFKNLNKSQTVPELYIHDNAKEKRNIIETIANEYAVKYKKHFSPSSNPNIGNTNKNKFIDLLDKLYDKHKINESNIKKLRKILEEANLKLSIHIPKNVSDDLRKKCMETGCYLFLLKNDKLEDFV